MRAVTPLALAILLALATPAGAAWKQPWTGVSATSGGINQSSSEEAGRPSMAVLGGVPHVAWAEHDNTNGEIRVARLNGSTWEQPWTGVSATSGGINQSTTAHSQRPSLATIDGVLHVAWVEEDIGDNEVRVARLNGSTWEQPWTGVSATSGGINQSTLHTASTVSLSGVGDVPHVAWVEDDGANEELRVARLNGSTWEQPWTGVSATSGGINQSTTEDASAPSLSALGGVPHVAWTEADGTNAELRVARLEGSTWEQPWDGVDATNGGINQSGTQDAVLPILTVAGGVPHVAWSESDGANLEVRLARLAGDAWLQPWTGVSATSGGVNRSTTQLALATDLAVAGGALHFGWVEADGTNVEARVARLEGGDWVEPWTGASDTSGSINHSTSRDASWMALTLVAGVPHLAFTESDGASIELRVARVEPEFSAVSALPTDTGATLVADVKTYGFAYPVGFQHGPGFATNTSRTTTSGDPATIVKQVTGLAPSTAVSFRPVATAGTPAPLVTGSASAFTTRPLNGPGPQGPGGAAGSQGGTGAQGPAGAQGPEGRPGRDARVRCRMVRARRVRCRVTFARRSTSSVRARLRRGRTLYATGRASVRGRHLKLQLRPVRRLRPGRYTLTLVTGRRVATQTVTFGR